MKVLKILGIVFGILLLLTGGALAVGSALASKGQAAFDKELTKSGFAGPVDGTVQSVDQTSPIIVTVSYTDQQGTQQTGRGQFSGGEPPQVGDTVSTYYSTSDPGLIVVVDLPGLGNLNQLGTALKTAAIICLIAGALLLLAGILGLALGKKQPAAVMAGQPYPGGQPQQPPVGYPSQPYPPQQPPSQPYPPMQPPGQPYPPYPPQQQPPNPPQR